MRSLWSSRSGQIGVFFALAAVPVIAGVGTAVDLSQGASKKADLQAALDSAVLAGMSVTAREKKLGASQVEVAKQTFVSIFKEPTSGLSFSLNDGVLSGQASLSLPSTFGRIVGINFISVTADAAASANRARMPVCFMAMHPSRKHTLELKESVSVFAPNCHIYGNSDHVDDVVDPHTPENFLTGKTVQAVGYGHHYLQNVKPPLERAPEILSDPLANFRIPRPEACTANALVVDGKKQKLTPGTYCNGLTFRDAKNVEFAPGTYIIDRGTLTIASSDLKAEGVTFVITNASTPIAITDSKIEFVAPKSGSMAAMSIISDRIASSGTITNSKIDVHGTIYMPNTEFVWTNTGKFHPKSNWTVWIVDGVSWRGSGVIEINFKYENSEIPFPRELMSVVPVVGPGRVRLIR